MPSVCGSCGVRVVMADEALRAERSSLRFVVPMNTSAWAIAAGYAGLFCLILVPGPVALILGAVAVWDLKRRPNVSGRGRAWFGLIAGVLATALLGVIVVARLSQ